MRLRSEEHGGVDLRERVEYGRPARLAGEPGRGRRRIRSTIWSSGPATGTSFAANWKIAQENYHECYHCPLIHPELVRISPADIGARSTVTGAPGSAARWS